MTSALPTDEPLLDERTIGLERIEYLIIVLQTKLERLTTVLSASAMPEAEKHRIIGLVAHTQAMIHLSIAQLEQLRAASAADAAIQERS